MSRGATGLYHQAVGVQQTITTWRRAKQRTSPLQRFPSSSSATFLPRCVSSYATDSPVIPPPITATSTSNRSLRGRIAAESATNWRNKPLQSREILRHWRFPEPIACASSAGDHTDASRGTPNLLCANVRVVTSSEGQCRLSDKAQHKHCRVMRVTDLLLMPVPATQRNRRSKTENPFGSEAGHTIRISSTKLQCVKVSKAINTGP